eukprot:13248195-Alexandrium_andersonii.AAC.1
MSASLVGSEMCIRDRHWPRDQQVPAPETRQALHRLDGRRAPLAELHGGLDELVKLLGPGLD